MNDLLAWDRFMPEMHLKQPAALDKQWFTYSDCGTFTKKKEERIRKFKERRDSRFFYQNKGDKACSQHDMANGDFEDLPRRTASDEVFYDKAFNIAKNSNLASTV